MNGINPSRKYRSASELLFISIIILIPGIFYPWSADVTSPKLLAGSLLVTIILCFNALFIIQTNQITLYKSAIHIPLALFLIWAIFSGFWSVFRWVWPHEMARLIPGFSIVLFSVSFEATKKFQEKCSIAFAVTAIVLSSYGVIQFFNIDFIHWGKPIRDGIITTMGHPNLLAPFLIIGLMACYNNFSQQNFSLHRIFWFFGFFLILIALFMTKSKGAIGGLVVALFIQISILSFHKKKYWVIALSIILASMVLLGFLILDKDLITTNSFRIWTWNGAIQIIKNPKSIGSLLMGRGLGTFALLFPLYRSADYLQNFKYAENLLHAHCEYLEIASELGFIGLVLFLWIFFAYFFRYINHFSRNDVSCWEQSAFVSIIAILIHNLVSVNLHWFSSWIMITVVLILASRSDQCLTLNRFRFPKIIILVIIFIGIVSSCAVSYHSYRLILSQINYYKGLIELHDGNSSQAAPYLIKSLDEWKYNLPARYDLAYVLSNQNDHMNAIEEYRIIEKVAPNYQRIHRNIAISYHTLSLQTGNPQLIDKAIVEMEKELNINETEDNNYYLAQLYQQQNMKQMSLDRYKQFIFLASKVKNDLAIKEQKRLGEKISLVKPHEYKNYDAKIKYALDQMKIMNPDYYNHVYHDLNLKYPNLYSGSPP